MNETRNALSVQVDLVMPEPRKRSAPKGSPMTYRLNGKQCVVVAGRIEDPPGPNAAVTVIRKMA